MLFHIKTAKVKYQKCDIKIYRADNLKPLNPGMAVCGPKYIDCMGKCNEYSIRTLHPGTPYMLVMNSSVEHYNSYEETIFFRTSNNT